MKTLRDVKIGDTVKVVKLHGEGAVKRRRTVSVTVPSVPGATSFSVQMTMPPLFSPLSVSYV